MRSFNKGRLPSYSTLLSGKVVPDEIGSQSDMLQIWYNNSSSPWTDEGLHAHQKSDECFVILKGSVTVQVDDEFHQIEAGSFCFFPKGIFHGIVSVTPPVEALVIRAPSVADKVYRPSRDF